MFAAGEIILSVLFDNFEILFVGLAVIQTKSPTTAQIMRTLKHPLT